MAVLNITYDGLSVDYPLDSEVPLSDADVRRIAVELVRSGALRGMSAPDLPEDAFAHYVVDRFDTPASSALSIVTGKVAEELAVENAVSSAWVIASI